MVLSNLTVKNEILDYLKFVSKDPSITANTPLISSCLIDSIDFIDLQLFISSMYDVILTSEDIMVSKIDTVEKIVKLLESKNNVI